MGKPQLRLELCVGLMGTSSALPRPLPGCGLSPELTLFLPLFVFSFLLQVLCAPRPLLPFMSKSLAWTKTWLLSRSLLPPWCLFLGKPSEAGVHFTGNVVLLAPILLLVHYHPSAETTSSLSSPSLCSRATSILFTHPLCASAAQGLPRMSWEILPLPWLGYLLLYQNSMKTNEEALMLLSCESPEL